MKERNDRYEEDSYYRREERDDPNEMDRDESLNDCLLEIARLANDARALTVRAPREFYIDFWPNATPTTCGLTWRKGDTRIKVREIIE